METFFEAQTTPAAIAMKGRYFFSMSILFFLKNGLYEVPIIVPFCVSVKCILAYTFAFCYFRKHHSIVCAICGAFLGLATRLQNGNPLLCPALGSK